MKKTVHIKGKGLYIYDARPGYVRVWMESADMTHYAMRYRFGAWNCECKGFRFRGQCCHVNNIPWRVPPVVRSENPFPAGAQEWLVDRIPYPELMRLSDKWSTSGTKQKNCAPPCVTCQHMDLTGCVVWRRFIARMKAA